MAKNRPPVPEPLTRERVLEAIRKSGGKAQKRDIARELGIGARPEERTAPHPARTGRRRRARAHRHASATPTPRRCPNPASWKSSTATPTANCSRACAGRTAISARRVRLAPGDARGRKGEAAIGVGDRVLARIHRDDDGEYEARVVKRLGQSAHRILGVYRANKDDRGRALGGGRVVPADRKARHDLIIDAATCRRR